MKHLKFACLLLATTALCGCVTSRSVVGVDTPQAANGNGQKVAITVLDERRFELKPEIPEIPSLKDGEITDKTITERAIARKRNGYGMALGDVLLPEGTKLSDLIAKSIAAAYGQAGYRVVQNGEKTADTQAVTVHVIEFWSWMSPGFFTAGVNNKLHLKVETGNASPAVEIVRQNREGVQVVTENDWKESTQQGLKAITETMAKNL
ncbi:flagellar biosynthesis protein [Pseudomonas sp. Ma2-10]